MAMLDWETHTAAQLILRTAETCTADLADLLRRGVDPVDPEMGDRRAMLLEMLKNPGDNIRVEMRIKFTRMEAHLPSSETVRFGCVSYIDPPEARKEGP